MNTANAAIEIKHKFEPYAEQSIKEYLGSEKFECGDVKELFDTTEIHPLIIVMNESYRSVEDNETPEFYSVFLHCVEGGVICVGDFTNKQDAETYEADVAAKYTH